METVEVPDSAKPAGDDDRSFQRQWFMLDPRKIQLTEEDEEAGEETAPVEDAEKFYIFKISWVIGQGTKTEPAEGTEAGVPGEE